MEEAEQLHRSYLECQEHADDLPRSCLECQEEADDLPRSCLECQEEPEDLPRSCLECQEDAATSCLERRGGREWDRDSRRPRGAAEEGEGRAHPAKVEPAAQPAQLRKM